MNRKTQRVVLRYTHLALGLALGAYVYIPVRLEDVRDGLRGFLMYVGIPLIVVTGVWMWKGASLRRLFTPRTP